MMPFAQCRLKWRLIVGLLLIICVVSAAKSDKKSGKNSQQKLAQQNQRLDEVQGSGQPPKSGAASIDDEVVRASGNNANPDDEDSLPVVEGSGQPPQNIIKPTPATTSKPKTTTTTELNELKIEDQEDDEDEDEDDDDEEDESELDEAPVLRPNVPDTTFAPQTTTTTTFASTTSAPRQIFELTTRSPPMTTNAPTFPSQIDAVSFDMLRPGLLAAISGGAVVGLLLTILLVMFIVYRMRKKDEGSYSLDEGTQHQPPHYSYAYQKAPTKEFYA